MKHIIQNELAFCYATPGKSMLQMHALQFEAVRGLVA